MPLNYRKGLPISAIKKKLYEKNWNVYSKKALGGVNSVLAYLGRYTHRVAISNSRLINVEDNKVTFRFKNYRKKEKQEITHFPVSNLSGDS
jgi:hypothetical protein